MNAGNFFRDVQITIGSFVLFVRHHTGHELAFFRTCGRYFFSPPVYYVNLSLSGCCRGLLQGSSRRIQELGRKFFQRKAKKSVGGIGSKKLDSGNTNVYLRVFAIATV